MKNGKIILAAIVLTTSILGGCSSQKNTVSENQSPSITEKSNANQSANKYIEYRDQFYDFKENFNPSPGFKLISPKDHIEAGTVSFPDSVSIDDKKSDGLTTEVSTKYDLLYKSEKSDMIIKVNFIYLDDAQFKEESEFITINTISRARNENIAKEYQDLSRPMMDEYFLRYKNKLIVINFIEQAEYKSEDQYKKKSESFIEEQLKFYESFEIALKNNFR